MDDRRSSRRRMRLVLPPAAAAGPAEGQGRVRIAGHAAGGRRGLAGGDITGPHLGCGTGDAVSGQGPIRFLEELVLVFLLRSVDSRCPQVGYAQVPGLPVRFGFLHVDAHVKGRLVARHLCNGRRRRPLLVLLLRLGLGVIVLPAVAIVAPARGIPHVFGAVGRASDNAGVSRRSWTHRASGTSCARTRVRASALDMRA